MASYIAILKNDLANGFSKRDLEVLIGLPKNSLASILTGKRTLSLKSQLKIKKWEGSEKPNPLNFHAILNQINENNKPENKERIENERNTVSEASKLAEYPLSQETTTDSDYDIRLMEDRVKVLEAELKYPPKTATIGVKNWIKVRERELSELKAKLKL